MRFRISRKLDLRSQMGCWPRGGGGRDEGVDIRPRQSARLTDVTASMRHLDRVYEADEPSGSNSTNIRKRYNAPVPLGIPLRSSRCWMRASR